MSRKATIEIDGKELKRVIRTRGLQGTDVSEGIGCCKGYISRCVRTGKLSLSSAELIKLKYGIDPSEYELKPIEEPEEETQEEPVAGAIDMDKYFNILYTAVYKAVRDALE